MDTISEINLKTKGWITSNAGELKKTHPDDVINAWEKGVLKGLDLRDEIIKDFFNKKLNKVLDHATRLFNILNDEVDMHCTKAFLRVNQIKEFEVLYLVGFNEYLTEKLKLSYKKALEVKKECKEEDIKFDFIFKPETKHTKIDNIFADGYLLRYVPKTRKA